MTYVVIGANYGDEGKGLMTDYLTREVDASTVCRFNGGTQAGHTVTTSDDRHVFGHVGSGTFAGADTYLSRDFIVNPIVVQKELEALSKKGIVPRIIVSGEARCTTIFDMLINAEIERSRGSDRHGSCGLGINETVHRNEKTPPFLFKHLVQYSLEEVAAVLKLIATEYVPSRLKELKLEPTGMLLALLSTTDFSYHATVMQHGASYFSLQSEECARRPFVFEGAQGLMLDEFLGIFPYVTRSQTGLPQAIDAAVDLGLKELTPVYVTRSYTTRHGRGPLNGEGSTISVPAPVIVDDTNVFNEFQESIRYAPLDLAAMANFIRADLERAALYAGMFNIQINEPVIAVTCMDQIGEYVSIVVSGGDTIWIEKKNLISTIEIATGIKVAFASYGPTAADVRRLLVDEDVL